MDVSLILGSLLCPLFSINNGSDGSVLPLMMFIDFIIMGDVVVVPDDDDVV